MGWDISYHPISEEQINSWYFEVLQNQEKIKVLTKEHAIEDFYEQKYADTIGVASQTDLNSVFDTSHGYYVAVIQGFFQKFFYTRGAALSFSENPVLQKYFRPWQKVISKEAHAGQIHNRITTNYSSGVFIPKDQVVMILNDYEHDQDVKEELDKLFSHDRIKVFLKALRFARENALGLLEATEVIEPNPLSLNESSCYSNLFNCDTEGPELYQKAAMEQFAQIEKEQNLEAGSISSKAEYKVTNINPKEKKEKKGFWKRLFGN